MHAPDQLVHFLHGVDGLAEMGGMGHSYGIPGQHACASPGRRYIRPCIPAAMPHGAGSVPASPCSWVSPGSCRLQMTDTTSRKIQGLPSCRPADHDTVAAGLVQNGFRFLRAVHIPVADHGNLHRILHLCDDIPVCLSTVILGSGPSMHRHRCHTAGFRDLRDLHGIDMVIIKTLPDLHGHRLVDGSD